MERYAPPSLLRVKTYLRHLHGKLPPLALVLGAQRGAQRAQRPEQLADLLVNAEPVHRLVLAGAVVGDAAVLAGQRRHLTAELRRGTWWGVGTTGKARGRTLHTNRSKQATAQQRD